MLRIEDVLVEEAVVVEDALAGKELGEITLAQLVNLAQGRIASTPLTPPPVEEIDGDFI